MKTLFQYFLSFFVLIIYLGCSSPKETTQPVEQEKVDFISYVTRINGYGDIFEMDFPNDTINNLTNNYADDIFQKHLPDLKKTIFVSFRDGNPEIYSMNYDGSEQTNLTNDSGMDALLDVSPHLFKILFLSNRDGGNKSYIMNYDGSELKKLAATRDPKFTFDSNHILYSHNGIITMMDIDGANKVELSDSIGSDYKPQLLPDGNSIIFLSYRNGNHGIYKMDINGNNVQLLTHSSGGDFYPQYCSINKKIVYVSHSGGFYSIYSINLDGSEKIQLTDEGSSNSPIISPYKSQIYYVHNNGDREIYLMDFDGSNKTNLTNDSERDNFNPQIIPNRN